MGLVKRVGVGQVNHGDTIGRNSNNAHSISAIENLEPRLTNLEELVTDPIVDGGNFGDGITGQSVDGGNFGD